jgi:CubicO group peptidase (beta-lactamase class C family)
MRLWPAALGVITAALLSAQVAAQQAAKLMPTDEPLSTPVANPGEPLPRARPEEVGMSSPRLAEIGKMLEAETAARRIPGAVVAIARRGKLVYFQAFGYRDKTAGAPMTVDTIFNIASMTKPLTAVAALMLYEDGKLLIGEPLASYLPAFRDMQVAVLDSTGEMIVDKVPAIRGITVQDLMRHTSGLIYGGRGATAVHKMYPAGCAASTAGDYLRFALMLLNKGKFGDTRILGRKTAEYMLSNQLGPEVKNLIAAADPTRADSGFGLSVAVRTTPGIVPMMGSVGEFGWPGGSGTNWWADPQEDLAVVYMAHTPGPIRWHYRQVINALVERAIMD